MFAMADFEIKFASDQGQFAVDFSADDMNADPTFGEVQVINIAENGLSAYEIAVKNGFKGSEAEWLESLKGEPGYTPVKGVDYFDGKDGYTPIKGKDYFDGEPGEPGKPGYTPVKGKDYFDGEPGAPGVSATHKWNGTVLSITSASGTSSVDLKGEKGDPGKTPVKGVDYFDGEPGNPGYTPVKGKDYFDGKDGYTPVKGKDYFDGEPGKTPVKGEDYWTDADKAEIKSYVDEAILGGEW